MKFGYARISTREQNFDLQIDALLKAGVDMKNIYKDSSSGATRERLEFDKMLSKLRNEDQVIVWRLDRIARSTRHISELIENWADEGIEFKSIQEPFMDTSSSYGKFMISMFGAFAQLERDIIVERTKAGLAAAYKRGRKGGRPHGLSKENKKKAKTCAKLYKSNNLCVEEIMDMVGIGSKATFYKYLRHEGVEPDGYVPIDKTKI